MPSSSTYDDVMLDHSKGLGEPIDFSFENKQVLEVYDSNSGAYTSGQMTYDLTSLATNRCVCDWSGADILLPVSVTLTSSEATGLAAEAANQYAVSIKNSVYQAIQSIDFSINGTNVVDTQAYTGVVKCYELLSSWSQDDAAVLGPQYLFSKDTGASQEWSNSLGEINNRTLATAADTLAAVPANKGKLDRSKWACVSLTDTILAAMVNAGNLNATRRGTVDTTGTQVLTFNLMLTIPLKGLHDVFVKMPLMRGAICKLIVNTHFPCENQIAASSAAPSVYTAQVNNLVPNGIFPFMLTNGSTAAGTGLKVNTASTLKLRCQIGNSVVPNTCIRVPLYTLTAQAEATYFASPVKTIRYDHYLSSVIRQPAATPLSNYQISPGRSNVRRLVMIPTLDGSASTGTIPAAASMLSSCPGTAAPYAAVSNFNVYLSGKALYQNNINYGYQMWLDETVGSASVNGGFNTGMRSGLVSKHDYETSYGIIDVDLSRHPASEDAVASAISVSLTTQHSKAIVWYVFLFYEKSIDINCDSGQLSA